MIAERGVAGTRLADVAERIGVSPPAVLYWFDSREQLLAEALVVDESRFYTALAPRLKELPDPCERLALLISAAASGADEFALWLELWNWSLRDPDLSDARERLDDRWRGRDREGHPRRSARWSVREPWMPRRRRSPSPRCSTG